MNAIESTSKNMCLLVQLYYTSQYGNRTAVLAIVAIILCVYILCTILN